MIFGDNIPDIIVNALNIELNKTENIYNKDTNPDGYLTIKTPVEIQPVYDGSDDEIIIEEVKNLLKEQDDYAVYLIGDVIDPDDKYFVDSAGTWQTGTLFFLIYAADPKYAVRVSRQILGFNKTEDNVFGKPPVTPINIGGTDFLKFFPFTPLPLNAMQVADGVYFLTYGIKFTIDLGG